MDYDNNRAERDFNMNPPTNAPGQGDDGWGDLFSNSSTSINQDPMGSANNANMGMNGFGGDINNILNGQQGMPGMPGVQGGYPQEPQKTLGDKASDLASVAVEKSVKGLIAYFKMLIKSLTNNTESEWHILGERICVVSMILGGLGLIFWLGSLFNSKLGFGASIAFGSAFAGIWGIYLVLKNRKDATLTEETSSSEDSQSSSDVNDSFFNDSDFNDSDDDYEESSYDEEEDYGDWDSFDGTDYSSVDGSFFASNDDFDAQEAVNNLDEIPAGQYTRQLSLIHI